MILVSLYIAPKQSSIPIMLLTKSNPSLEVMTFLWTFRFSQMLLVWHIISYKIWYHIWITEVHLDRRYLISKQFSKELVKIFWKKLPFLRLNMLCDTFMRILIFSTINVSSLIEPSQGMVITSYMHNLNIPKVTNQASPPSIAKLLLWFFMFIGTTFRRKNSLAFILLWFLSTFKMTIQTC